MADHESGRGSATHPLQLLLTRQFALFVLVGGLAAVIHWGSRIWFTRYVDFRLALVLAYAVGIAAAYLLNKRFVFSDSGRDAKTELRWFVFFNIAAFPLVWGASVLLAEQAMPRLGIQWHPLEISHAIAISLPIVMNFYLHKFITFRVTPEGP